MSETVPDDPEAQIDASEIFGKPLGPPYPESHGRPDDYPGLESLAVLLTPGGRYTAGKSYRPDPTGSKRAIKVSDYDLGWLFLCYEVWIEGLDQLFGLLNEISSDPHAFVVRGRRADWLAERKRHLVTGVEGYVVHRRSARIHGLEGYFQDTNRQCQMLDLDGVPLPHEMSVVADPEACIRWAIIHLLPPEFRDASFVYQLSSSAGLTKRDDELNVHLWFFTNREYWDEELRAWAGWWNAKQQRKIIDPAVFTPVQPHYTNEPELLDGLIDPLAGRRLGLIRRGRRTVRLYMPTAEEISAELRSRTARAIRICEKAKDRSTGKRKAKEPNYVQGDHPAVGLAEPDDLDHPAVGLAEPDDLDHPAVGLAEPDDLDHPAVGLEDAVKLGPGWRGYLMAVGFEGHIRTQIRAAIGSYFYEHGSRGDRDLLTAAIGEAIAVSPFLDCDEPWSRPLKDALNYLAAPQGGKSNVDEMIADFARRQAEREKQANERCEPAWELPTLTAEEAFAQISAAIHQVILEAVAYRNPRSDTDGVEDIFHHPPRTAVSCSPGTGKTEAMVSWVTTFLAADPEVRVAVAVPTHKLGEGLAQRINAAYGSEIASEWYGPDHLDPLAPDQKMCRLADMAKELTGAGGKLQFLCSRGRGKDVEYCPHHPQVAAVAGCGYQRQQSAQVKRRTRAWVIPATMLAAGPPPALKRPSMVGCGDFDLLVIDEAPWFSLLREPLKIPVEDFSPQWWTARPSRASAYQKRCAVDLLGKIHALISGRPTGEVPADEFKALGITPFQLRELRRSVWRFKGDLRKLVRPGAKRAQLNKALSGVAAHNRRIVALAEALLGLNLHAGDKLAPSGVALTDEGGGRYLRLKWRQDIDRAWLRAPTLYLDAADVGSVEIAKAWLPSLVLKVDARAKAPHMRVVQLVDKEISYRNLVARREEDETTVSNNQKKIARIIKNRGPRGLVICPKRLQDTWEAHSSLPAGWLIWHFGAIRGRDEARSVPQLVVVSRPLPGPAELETVAETIFGRRVGRLPPRSWYPKKAVGRLMSDGTGRRALGLGHPDPFVEAVRFSVCEGELLQAIGRGRGVRRTAETPLNVLVLTNLPLPLPVDQLITEREVCDDAGPLGELLTRGVVPLDYAGMAVMLPDRFDDPGKVKDWFRYRPELYSTLKAIRQMARDKGGIDLREFGEISYIESLMGDSPRLAAYRYRRSGLRQSSIVLVNGAMHAKPRAAVEAALGPINDFRPAARKRQAHVFSNEMSQPVLDEKFWRGGATAE